MNKQAKNYIAIDQYGDTYKLPNTKTPRKDLLKALGATNATKMYVDTTDGTIYHTGYIINGLWLSLYEITPFRVKA